ncbi:BamA/TamA family outer membrane protein [Mucilaginibacter achroorhodeus]|uniref:BamA/TamA family outer membrane protein n=1 Tax=Mucilaginibacter achroorhodeus TaxID=2599294 RepID=A0A563U1K5_9SPHI|nr:BamA/TamA family outer membrane protein [Mucilaginibacter achroorhodeus]TWR25496.1 BamA/TamA family outer membrane protein [Mucilaginibacter achroorhodeus]
MYKLLAAAFLCLLTAASHGQNATTIIPSNNTVRDTSKQTDLIDIYRSIFKPKATKPRFSEDKTVYFSILPFGGQVPGGTGKALITSTTAGIYLGPRQTTNISSATFTPYLNFRGRFGLPLRTSVWLPNNEWTIQGDTRFLVYPQYTWGLGSKNGYLDRTLVDYKYIRFYQSVLKQIKPYLFAGVGYNLDYRINVRSDDPNVDLKEFTGYNYGVNGNSFSSGVTLNLLYDTRNNSINPLPGAYANIVYRVNPKFLGSQENWTSIYIDVRKYMSMNPGNPNQQNTLAFWSYLWKAFSNKTPYLDLPSIGWDPYNRSARGIDQNRYRGRTLLYFETEYRRDITRNGLLGFVLFSNINTVSGSKSLFTSWHPAAGTGLRVKFNKGANTNVGIDYGFSQGYRAIMLNLGEAF